MTESAAQLFVSSCEVPELEVRPARRLLRFDPATFSWEGVPVQAYKPAVESVLAWEGVTRRVLVGASGEPTAFQLRYFEIQPGGFSSLERHDHAHAVLVLRGRGRVRVGDERPLTCTRSTWSTYRRKNRTSFSTPIHTNLSGSSARWTRSATRPAPSARTSSQPPLCRHTAPAATRIVD